MTVLHERHESLWRLTVGPTAWAVHFLLCYITAAVWCAKLGDQPLLTVRWLVAAYTVAALAVIGFACHQGLRRHRYGDAHLPHDDNTPEDRHRQLGFSMLLLSGLSAIAVLLTALPAWFFESCR